MPLSIFKVINLVNLLEVFCKDSKTIAISMWNYFSHESRENGLWRIFGFPFPLGSRQNWSIMSEVPTWFCSYLPGQPHVTRCSNHNHPVSPSHNLFFLNLFCLLEQYTWPLHRILSPHLFTWLLSILQMSFHRYCFAQMHY